MIINDKFKTLLQNPAFEQIIREAEDLQQRENVAARQRENARFLSDVGDLDKNISLKNKELAAQRGRVELLESQLRNAQNEFFKLAVEKRDFDRQRDNRSDEHALFMKRSCDPRIDEAIKFISDALDRSRREDRIQSYGEDELVFTGGSRRFKTIKTNRDAVMAKLDFLKNAVYVLENMKLEPEFDELAVESLVAGIPAANVFTEVK